jgi:hypothetical protein
LWGDPLHQEGCHPAKPCASFEKVYSPTFW